MRIGGLSSVYPTYYVYNPNTVSAGSMNKLSRVPDDVLSKKTDYSETSATEENQNPLRKGQTINFEDVLARQMQQGQSRATRFFPNGLAPVDQKPEEELTKQLTTKEQDENVEKETAVVANVTANESGATAGAASDNNTAYNMQMQRAIEAYEMFMTA